MSSNLELDAALKVLMDAGYEIGAANMKISGGDGAIHVPVDGVPRTFDDIFEMATAENQKPRKGPWTGQYVRLKDAPRTHQGELGDATFPNGNLEYLFQIDPRLDAVAGATRSFYISENDVEPCEPPTDSEVTAINAFMEHTEAPGRA
jgi:hypothetical protein